MVLNLHPKLNIEELYIKAVFFYNQPVKILLGKYWVLNDSFWIYFLNVFIINHFRSEMLYMNASLDRSDDYTEVVSDGHK